uniref:Uncharacterized protein n=1 Tax=Nelumbo nucifera TaxID=4432 RepID=A0A822XTN4_NELNU|nr:TPA_asm: hypothetical protein HUJ06_023922 [Nelumbo nucifera]
MSLKPVANWKCIIHHQVLKIREEDSHLCENIAKGLKEKLATQNLTSQMGRFIPRDLILGDLILYRYILGM